MHPIKLGRQTLDLVYGGDALSRLDESPDRGFYRRERLVDHLDATALATVRRVIGALVVEERPVLLDLMAGPDSHLPDDLAPALAVGLGLNAAELAGNPRLDGAVVHDLNADPGLPFADASFDVVLNVVSVDYLVHPFSVFREVGRVLRPGGLVLVVFSNRMFPPKAVKIWRDGSEAERVLIVEDYLQESGLFTEPRQLVSRGLPRPPDDRHAGDGLPSDPVFALWAERRGGAPGRPERRPPDLVGPPPWDEAEIARRCREVARTRRCPYCGERLRTWAVPQTPFTEYDVDRLWVCFNDRCPYLVRGWQAMDRQGNRGYSYRMMYHPAKGYCGSLPVPSLRALRESIVDDERDEAPPAR